LSASRSRLRPRRRCSGFWEVAADDCGGYKRLGRGAETRCRLPWRRRSRAHAYRGFNCVGRLAFPCGDERIGPPLDLSRRHAPAVEGHRYARARCARRVPPRRPRRDGGASGGPGRRVFLGAPCEEPVARVVSRLLARNGQQLGGRS
jgi:hypothetical protein